MDVLIMSLYYISKEELQLVNTYHIYHQEITVIQTKNQLFF
jgi:hypothetical protein